MTKTKLGRWLDNTLLAMPIILLLANNIVLLNLHPLWYYYTLDGLKLSALVSLAELPVHALWWRRFGDRTITWFDK